MKNARVKAKNAILSFLKTVTSATRREVLDGALLSFGLSKEERTIDVQFFDREGKLFLQITNPCQEDILFENGIPVSNQQDHGIGVQSICAIVERYGGVHTFTVQDGSFILRLSL